MWKTLQNFPSGYEISDRVKRQDILKDYDFDGVYIIFYGNKILYIGQSRNIRKRLHSHFIRVSYLRNMIKELYGDNDLIIKIRKDKFKFERLTLEAKLIGKINPLLNSRN